jgi:hypothetical protein
VGTMKSRVNRARKDLAIFMSLGRCRLWSLLQREAAEPHLPRLRARHGRRPRAIVPRFERSAAAGRTGKVEHRGREETAGAADGE